MVLHGFKSQGSKTRSIDTKFAAPYVGWWPIASSRGRAASRSLSGKSRNRKAGETRSLVENDPKLTRTSGDVRFAPLSRHPNAP